MKKINKKEVYTIKPTDIGGVNEMILIFRENDKDIGCEYKIHHWHKNINGIIKMLEQMIEQLKKFKRY